MPALFFLRERLSAAARARSRRRGELTNPSPDSETAHCWAAREGDLGGGGSRRTSTAAPFCTPPFRGNRGRPKPPSASSLRRLVAEDVLIEPARMRAAVAAERARRGALLAGRRQHRAALVDVGRRRVL